MQGLVKQPMLSTMLHTFLAVSSHSRRLISARKASSCGTSTGMRRPMCSTSRIFFRGALCAARAADLAFHSSALLIRAVRPSVSGTAAGREAASCSISSRVDNAGRVLPGSMMGQNQNIDTIQTGACLLLYNIMGQELQHGLCVTRTKPAAVL